jgi:hypothetical protein
MACLRASRVRGRCPRRNRSLTDTTGHSRVVRAITLAGTASCTTEPIWRRAASSPDRISAARRTAGNGSVRTPDTEAYNRCERVAGDRLNVGVSLRQVRRVADNRVVNAARLAVAWRRTVLLISRRRRSKSSSVPAEMRCLAARLAQCWRAGNENEPSGVRHFVCPLWTVCRAPRARRGGRCG